MSLRQPLREAAGKVGALLSQSEVEVSSKLMGTADASKLDERLGFGPTNVDSQRLGAELALPICHATRKGFGAFWT